MGTKLNVKNQDRNIITIEVLDFYHSDKYNHEYVLYTMGEEVDGNNYASYLGIITEIRPNEYTISEITNPEEEQEADKMVKEAIDTLMNRR